MRSLVQHCLSSFLLNLFQFMIVFSYFFPFVTLKTLYKLVCFLINLLDKVHSLYQISWSQFFYLIHLLIWSCPFDSWCWCWTSWSILTAMVTFPPRECNPFTKSVPRFSVLFSSDDDHYDWVKSNLNLHFLLPNCWKISKIFTTGHLYFFSWGFFFQFFSSTVYLSLFVYFFNMCWNFWGRWFLLIIFMFVLPFLAYSRQ